MARIKLNITSNSKPIPDDVAAEIEDLSFNSGGNGIEVVPHRDDFPTPWDAVCYIENGFFILDGNMGQQGSHRGWAKTGIPLDKVNNYLDVSIYAEDEEASENIETILGKYGWM